MFTVIMRLWLSVYDLCEYYDYDTTINARDLKKYIFIRLSCVVAKPRTGAFAKRCCAQLAVVALHIFVRIFTNMHNCRAILIFVLKPFGCH